MVGRTLPSRTTCAVAALLAASGALAHADAERAAPLPAASDAAPTAHTPPGAPAETTRDDAAFCCAYSGADTTRPDLASLVFSKSDAVRKIVEDILDELSIPANFVVEEGPVPDAMATIVGADRFVVYNPDFVSKLESAESRWTVYSVMAHEIGHHLAGHTLSALGSRPDIELEADEFSGAMLQRLGATLEQAQLAVRTFGAETATATHPGRDERLDAIERGWTKSSEREGERPETRLAALDAAPTTINAAWRTPAPRAPNGWNDLDRQGAPGWRLVPCRHMLMTPAGPRPAHRADRIPAFGSPAERARLASRRG